MTSEEIHKAALHLLLEGVIPLLAVVSTMFIVVPALAFIASPSKDLGEELPAHVTDKWVHERFELHSNIAGVYKLSRRRPNIVLEKVGNRWEIVVKTYSFAGQEWVDYNLKRVKYQDDVYEIMDVLSPEKGRR